MPRVVEPGIWLPLAFPFAVGIGCWCCFALSIPVWFSFAFAPFGVWFASSALAFVRAVPFALVRMLVLFGELRPPFVLQRGVSQPPGRWPPDSPFRVLLSPLSNWGSGFQLGWRHVVVLAFFAFSFGFCLFFLIIFLWGFRTFSVAELGLLGFRRVLV